MSWQSGRVLKVALGTCVLSVLDGGFFQLNGCAGGYKKY
jgi:hypothetical protein